MKKARLGRTNTLWFNFYEHLEETNSQLKKVNLEITRGWWEGELLLNGYKPIWGDEKFWEEW